MNVSDNMTLQGILESRTDEPITKLRNQFEWPGRACLLFAILIAPWLFGSVYFSAKLIIAICLLVGVALLWFESSVSERRSLVMPYILIPMATGILIVLLQLVPLPESMDGLLGRQKELYPFLTGDAATDVSISMSREGTWDQLGLLLVAFCGVCLGCRYFRTLEHVKVLLTAVTINGVAISLFGMIQSLTEGNRGVIYWVIPLLEGGAPFGPYVNRNNAAGYLLICLGCSLGLLAIVFATVRKGPKPMGTKDLPFWTQFNTLFLRFIAELNATKLASGIGVIVIAAGVMSTLSRGGVLAMLAGLAITLLFYGMARRPSFSAFIFLPSITLAFAIVGWLGFSEQLLERFEGVNTVEVTNQSDARLRHWQETWPAVSEFGIFGSGVGAYDEVHRLYRADKETAVFVYAENQFYQTLVELGWPGFICLMCAWGLLCYYSMFLLWNGASAGNIGLGVAGVFATFSVGLASVFDFGLYLPANMLLMSLFAGFAGYHAHSLSSRRTKQNWLRFETPNAVAQVLLLALFAALAMYSLDFYRKWQIEAAVRQYPIRTFAFNNPDLDETDRLITEISPLVQSTRNHEGLDYMARLFIHRSRLQLYRDLESELTDDVTEKQRWDRTSLNMIHENAWSLRDGGMLFSASQFLRGDFVVENLPWARQYLLDSRRIAPMQPNTHIRLAQVNALIGTTAAASKDIDRAIYVAPKKPDLRLLAALHYLQSRNPDAAIEHLHELLLLEPREFKRSMKLVFGGSNRNVAKIDPLKVATEVVPDDPQMLFDLSSGYLEKKSEAWQAALDRADRLLEDISPSDGKRMLLKAKIKLAKEEYADAIEWFGYRLDSNPADYETQFALADVLYRTGDFEGAKTELEYILRMGPAKLRGKSEKMLDDANRKLREQARDR